MIAFHAVQGGHLQRIEQASGAPAIPTGTLWIDLLTPTAEEESFVEAALKLDIPTREELAEIEASSRLYGEHDALFMTAVVIAGITEHRPTTSQVTFVLTPDYLVTMRYTDPQPFRTFAAKCDRQPEAHTSSDQIFVSLIDHIIERIADVLEKVAADLETISREVFEDGGRAGRMEGADRPFRTDLKTLLKHLGRSNSLTAKLRESLLSFTLLLAYFRETAGERVPAGARTKIKTLDRDVRSLTEYNAHLASEISFLLEAALGLINIEQNQIIKVFSIAAVLFLPPTLVGTIYGMNFEVMPELKWAFGYPFSILLMIASAIAPYCWFKQKGWL